MRRTLGALLLVSCLVAGGTARAAGEIPDALPVYTAEDLAAPAVTAGNLVANERFWPYQVALVTAWKPDARSGSLAAGSSGVLVRVEQSDRARIDFGRDGLREVPITATDLVARANQVRLGTLDKMAPNFVLAIGPRLLDAEGESLRPIRAEVFSAPRAFLCVFADPNAKDFAKIAKALGPLRERAGLMTVLFPQGERPDAAVRETLRKLGWPVPFVQDHLSEAYTPSLLADTQAPALLLVTDEGRALLREPWASARVAEIGPLLEAIR